MKEVRKQLKAYLDRILHVDVEIRPWGKESQLSHFLLNTYVFERMDFLKRPCLLMIVKEDVEITPALIEKHWSSVQAKWPEYCCIFVQEMIISYNRRALIRHGVPFIDPQHQLYLPELGVDLKEHLRGIKTKVERFSPATQLTLLYVFQRREQKEYTPLLLSEKLGLTPMTLTRVFNELESFSVGVIERRGRERCWTIGDDWLQLWQQTKEFMRSPVKHRIGLEQPLHPSLKGGLSALAEYTMLTAPSRPVGAISLGAWQGVKKSLLTTEVLTPEQAPFELEVWYYNPQILAKGDIVDPFSLYLSLQENRNERVEMALDEMMENMS